MKTINNIYLPDNNLVFHFKLLFQNIINIIINLYKNQLYIIYVLKMFPSKYIVPHY